MAGYATIKKQEVVPSFRTTCRERGPKMVVVYTFSLTLCCIGVCAQCFRWEGTGWLNVLEFGSDAPWTLKVTADLTPRSDTSLVNSSPFAPMTTIISVKLGCNMVIDIPGEARTSVASHRSKSWVVNCTEDNLC